MNDKEIIKEILLNNYHKGHETSNGELYRPIFHKEWRIFWINEDSDKIEFTDKETYISWYKSENIVPELKWVTNILNIDIEGNLATAKIKIANQEFGYMDYFQLMRIKNKWIIINKISERIKVE